MIAQEEATAPSMRAPEIAISRLSAEPICKVI
jgi:hypothetical protein